MHCIEWRKKGSKEPLLTLMKFPGLHNQTTYQCYLSPTSAIFQTQWNSPIHPILPATECSTWQGNHTQNQPMKQESLEFLADAAVEFLVLHLLLDEGVVAPAIQVMFLQSSATHDEQPRLAQSNQSSPMCRDAGSSLCLWDMLGTWDHQLLPFPKTCLQQTWGHE